MPPAVTLRPAAPADLPLLQRFQQAIVAAERPYDATLRAGELQYYDLEALLADPAAALVVAVVDEQVVGSGFARLEAAKPYLRHARHAYLGFMYVEPAHRGQGINAQIVGELKRWAEGQGVHELRLEVYAGNDPARKAYEKFGFRPHLLEMRFGA